MSPTSSLPKAKRVANRLQRSETELLEPVFGPAALGSSSWNRYGSPDHCGVAAYQEGLRGVVRLPSDTAHALDFRSGRVPQFPAEMEQKIDDYLKGDPAETIVVTNFPSAPLPEAFPLLPQTERTERLRQLNQ